MNWNCCTLIHYAPRCMLCKLISSKIVSRFKCFYSKRSRYWNECFSLFLFFFFFFWKPLARREIFDAHFSSNAFRVLMEVGKSREGCNVNRKITFGLNARQNRPWTHRTIDFKRTSARARAFLLFYSRGKWQVKLFRYCAAAENQISHSSRVLNLLVLLIPRSQCLWKREHRVLNSSEIPNACRLYLFIITYARRILMFLRLCVSTIIVLRDRSNWRARPPVRSIKGQLKICNSEQTMSDKKVLRQIRINYIWLNIQFHEENKAQIYQL